MLVGVLVDSPSDRERLEPAISNLGWRAVELDAAQPDTIAPGDINLIVFSLGEIDTVTLQNISEIALYAKSKILVISSDRDPQSIADALRSGADDYLVSPFDLPELEARMYSLVTRVWPSTDRRSSQDIAFDFDMRTISAGPYSVRFTPLEWDVLVALMEYDGVPVPAEEIARELDFRNVQSSTIPTIVSRIRRKLEVNNFPAVYVSTIQNRGYVAQFRRSSDHWIGDAGRSVHTNSNAPHGSPAASAASHAVEGSDHRRPCHQKSSA